MIAGPWTFLVGEPVVVPWSVLIAFRWYLPISIPYLLRRTPLCQLLAPKEAHTCVHLLYRRYHPIASSIRLGVVLADLIFSDNLLVLLYLCLLFSTCRKVVAAFGVRIL